MNKTEASINQVKKKQSGQTLLEFVMLLLLVSSLSFLFFSLTQDKISEVWIKMVNIIADTELTKENLR